MAGILVIALTACTRGQATGSNATPDQVYGAGMGTGDVRSLLGSSDWWEATPSFLVRPLDLPNLPETIKFAIGRQYVHIGTPETLNVNYVVYTTTSAATSSITDRQNQIGTSNTTSSPRVGDQSLYYGYKSVSNTALYSMFGFVRIGQAVIDIDLERAAGFADLSLMGKIANKAEGQLKNVLTGKAHPSPQPVADKKLLPPSGPLVTLVGTARLPVEALAGSIGSASPQALVDAFHQLGVTDFLYSDYALDADLTMEVKANLFSFSSPDAATSWIDQVVGASNVDASGVSSFYSASSGQYIGVFVVSHFGGIVFCLSTTPGQAASRACESPFGTFISVWQESLSTQ